MPPSLTGAEVFDQSKLRETIERDLEDFKPFIGAWGAYFTQHHGVKFGRLDHIENGVLNLSPYFSQQSPIPGKVKNIEVTNFPLQLRIESINLPVEQISEDFRRGLQKYKGHGFLRSLFD